MASNVPRAEILELIRNLVAVPATIWEGESQPFPGGDGVWVELKDSPDIDASDDEVRREFIQATQTLKETVIGRRRFTLHVTIRDLSGATYPQDLAEKLRLRMSRTSSQDFLSKIGLSIVSMQKISETPKKVDTRQAKWAVLDIIFNYVVTEVDEQSQGGWIETVDDATEGQIPGALTS